MVHMMRRAVSCVYPMESAMDFKSYDELDKLVKSNGNVISCFMAALRDAHGAGKLGINVVSSISEALDHRGLGHFPKNLPVNQWDKVRVYKKGTNVATLLSAALSVGEDDDAKIREFANNTAVDEIKRIRQIVCG